MPSLLQSVKTTAGFWRKTRRGAGIGDVVVLGLNPDRGRLLRNAIAIAVPSSRVSCWPEPSEEEGSVEEGHPSQGRISMLEAAGLEGRFAPRLDIPLPMRARNAVVGSVLLLAASLGVVGSVQSEVDERVAVIESSILRAREVSRELGELERDHQRALGEATYVAHALQRLDAVESSGLGGCSGFGRLRSPDEGVLAGCPRRAAPRTGHCGHDPPATGP